MKKDSKNVYGNPRLQRPSLTLNTFAQPYSFSVKLGLCNLEFPQTFLESADIIQYCSGFGFPVTWHALPYRRLKHTVEYHSLMRSMGTVNMNISMNKYRASLKGMFVFKFGSIVRPVPRPADRQLIGHSWKVQPNSLATQDMSWSEAL